MFRARYVSGSVRPTAADWASVGSVRFGRSWAPAGPIAIVAGKARRWHRKTVVMEMVDIILVVLVVALVVLVVYRFGFSR